MSQGFTTALRAVFAGAALIAMPALAADAAGFDIDRDLDAEYRPIVQMLQEKAAHEPKLSAATLATIRGGNPMTAPPAESPAWSERSIAGPKGAPDLRIYIINAGAKDAGKPAILHTHGGGYVLGNAKNSIAALQKLAAELDCVIVSVDYRLAPETPFPGSLEDNYAGLKWLYDNAAELGVDRTRIALMGESAGGGHAAALAIAARDRREVPLVLQVLVYPMLDDRTGSTRQVAPHIGTLVWNKDANRFGWSSLLGVPAGSKKVPKGAVPARVENLAGLAPAFIAVGGLDLFVDEDIEYAKRLNAAGVPTQLLVVPRVPHGFDYLPDTKATKAYQPLLLDALRRAFGKTG